MEPQRLRRRAEGGPAVDAEDRHLSTGQLTTKNVAEAADGRVVLDDDHGRSAGTTSSSHSRSTRLSQGMSTTVASIPCSTSSSAAVSVS